MLPKVNVGESRKNRLVSKEDKNQGKEGRGMKQMEKEQRQ